MRRELLTLTVILLSFGSAFAVIGPVAYLTEEITDSYYPNGSPISTSRIGYVEVGVPNTFDVLQFIMVDLTGNSSRVNLLNWTTYQSVAASPNYDFERTRLFHNTTASDMDAYYNITDDYSAPGISALILVTNLAGGHDLYSNDNIWDHYSGAYTTDVNLMNFKINVTNPSSYMSLGSTNLTIVFQKDSGSSGEDAVNITTSISASTGSAYSVDNDSDGYNESVFWTGTFTPGMILEIDFNGTITEGYNLINATTSLDLNGLDTNTRGARIEYVNNTSTFTEISISGKFSRGPVLEGIDMATAGPSWRVRGFIENVANDSATNQLTYNVTEWRLYDVIASGAPNASPVSSNAALDSTWQQMTPGIRKYTPFIIHSSSEKPYYTPYFDWHVEWNDTWQHYEGRINTTLQFQTLYLNDISNNKVDTGLLLPLTENLTVTIEDTITHVGSNQIDLDMLYFNSTIPHLMDNGSPGGLFRLNTSSIKVYYTNSTSTYEIDQASSTVAISYADPTITADGYVRLNVSDVATTDLVQGNPIGVNLTINNYITLKYDVLSNATMDSGYNFTFTGNGTSWTETPNQEAFPNKTVTVAPKRLTAYKSLIAYDPNNPTLINVTIRFDITDKSPLSTGISGIKFIDYLPNGTDFNSSTPVYVSFYNMSSGSWETWTKTVEYSQTSKGWVTLSDGYPAEAWEYTNSTNATGWTLYDNETLIFTYQFNVSDARVYTLPVELAGFDPDTGLDLSTSTFGAISVIIPEGLLEPVINEGELTLSKFVTVGRPAEWIKVFEVYNPNMRPMRATFETTVFPDTVKAYATYTDLEGKQVSEEMDYVKKDDNHYATWTTSLMPFETRTYYIKVLTPAVISVDREITVLEKLDEDTVKLRLDVDLKNLALEDYPEVNLYLPIRSEQLTSAVDSLGNELSYSGVTAVIQIPDMKALEARSVTIDFKESYPIVIVTPNQDEYASYSNINLGIRVINGGERVEHPFLETEVYSPYEDTVYSNIMGIPGLGIIEIADHEESFLMPAGAPTGMYLASVRFREDFNVISTGEATFKYVGGGGYMIIGMFMLIGAIIGVSYLGYKKFKAYKELGD